MTAAEPMSPSTSQFMTRLAVTLGALAVYRLGAHLPLAGIEPELLAELHRTIGSAQASERLSVVALGVSPVIAAMLLAEVARLASTRFDAWASADALRMDHYVLILSLLFAAVQGYGLTVTLEEFRHLVTEPGVLFRVGTVATLVAGTAFLVWLAALISRQGIGSGIWVLLLAPYLADMPTLVLPLYEAVQSGSISAAGCVATFAYALVAVAAIAVLAHPLTGSAIPLDRVLIWPLFIAAYAAGALAVLPRLLPAGPISDIAAALLNPGGTLYLAALVMIVILVSLAEWRRVKAYSAAGLPVALTALTLAAIAVVPELLVRWFEMPLLVEGRLLAVAVVVALAAQSGLPRRWQP
jgi:preprotein translocase subunit SecY